MTRSEGNNDNCLSPEYCIKLDLDEEEQSTGVSPIAVKSEDTKSKKRSSDKGFTKSKAKRRIEDNDLTILNTVQEIRNDLKTAPMPFSVQMIRECMQIVMRMSELSTIEKAKVGNLMRTGNAYAIFLDMDHETRLEWIKLEFGDK